MTKDKFSVLQARIHEEEMKESETSSETAQTLAEDSENDSVTITISNDDILNSVSQFLKAVDGIQQIIQIIQKDIKEVQKQQKNILNTPVPQKSDEEKLDVLDNGIKTMSKKAWCQLKTTEKSLKRNYDSPAELRIRQNSHAALTQQLITVMHNYNKVQMDYKERCKGQIKKQLEITGNTTLPDDQLEELLESGDPHIFTGGVIKQMHEEKSKLQELEARYRDLLKLETSIRELNELFTDVAMLVENQGDMINRIEYQVENAQEYVVKTKSHLKVAEELQTSARKKKIICYTILGVTVTLVVILLLSYLA